MKILEKIKEEIINVIPAVIFFAVSFNLIVFNDSLLHTWKNYGPGSYLSATLGGLVVGKFLLIVNQFPFINVFPNRPIIYNIIWKFMIYGSFSFLFRLIEKSVYLMYEIDNPIIVYHHLQAEVTSPSFWMIQIWLLILFVIYIVACEFIRVLGKDRVKEILFGKKEKTE